MSDQYRDSPEDEQAQARATQRSEIDIWFNWLNQLIVLARTLARLFEAELRLAAGDLSRMLLCAFLLIPLVLLSWLGLSIFLSWLSYSYFEAPWVGFLSFFLIQCLTALLLIRLISVYRRSLSLPVTRKHIREMSKDFSNEPQRPTGSHQDS
ncbi:hypothetical protein QGM61_13135 [Pseudohongiella sp. SYSU M77423]|uniref:hypothetical protein n=1 Tax=Pseudohongiella sp. SYSU M77423 TaxID=3042312 RepID=UPI002480DCA6|nr:hypothetical protein [Pseudohongiella sp. SYSU M77423]MDH7944767.1 hypothetical protein [Pseudohongiella sp. SYSU M77423]MEC8860009.1 hypothetical protein [Pseudomonadota bacterium]